MHQPFLAPTENSAFKFTEIIINILNIWPFLIVVFAIMGSITFGIATPTEAAGVGVIATIILGKLWGSLTFRKLVEAIFSATLLYASIMFVVIGATILAQAVSLLGIPQSILETVRQTNLGPVAVLITVILVYLILGCFFDGLSLMIMTLPILLPLMIGLGYDPIWLGVIVTIMIEIGQVTPPVGLNLSVLVSVAKEKVSLGETALATMPYWLILLLGIGILTLAPELALFLPSSLMQ